MLWVHDCCSCICIFHDKKGAVFAFLRRFAAPSSSSLSLSPPSRQHTSHTQPLSAVLAAAAAAAARAAATKGHDDPRRYGAQTSNLWSTRVLGVRLLLRGGPACCALLCRPLASHTSLRCRPPAANQSIPMPAAAHNLGPFEKRCPEPPTASRVKPAWNSDTARAAPRSAAHRESGLPLGDGAKLRSGVLFVLYAGPGWRRGTFRPAAGLSLRSTLAFPARAPRRALGHDDPRRYGAQTSNLWSTRVLGVRLLLRGGPACFACWPAAAVGRRLRAVFAPLPLSAGPPRSLCVVLWRMTTN